MRFKIIIWRPLDGFEKLAIAWADMSTGSFQVQECARPDIEAMLTQLNVAEFIYPEDIADIVARLGIAIREHRLGLRVQSAQSEAALCAQYQLASLQGLGQFSPPMLSAAGGLLAYLRQTQLEAMPYKALSAQWPDAFMVIDAATRKSLELTRTLAGSARAAFIGHSKT